MIRLLMVSISLRADFYGLKMSGRMLFVGDVVESPITSDLEA